MKIFTGNANPALAKEICEHLGVPLGTATVNRFPDGETFVQINENIRGCDVYVIQPTCAPANDRIMELLIMIDALRRASAARITATAAVSLLLATWSSVLQRCRIVRLTSVLS